MRRQRRGCQRAQLLGHLCPDRVEQFVHRATPFSQRDDQVVFTVDAVGDVLFELGVGVPHRRPVTRAEHVEVFAQPQPGERKQVPGHRATIRADEDAALPQHRVAGEAGAVGHQGVVVGCVTRSGHGLERSEAHVLAEQHVDRAAPARQRRRVALEQRTDSFGVVVMIVGQHHPSQPAAGIDGGTRAREMLV